MRYLSLGMYPPAFSLQPTLVYLVYLVRLVDLVRLVYQVLFRLAFNVLIAYSPQSLSSLLILVLSLKLVYFVYLVYLVCLVLIAYCLLFFSSASNLFPTAAQQFGQCSFSVNVARSQPHSTKK